MQQRVDFLHARLGHHAGFDDPLAVRLEGAGDERQGKRVGFLRRGRAQPQRLRLGLDRVPLGFERLDLRGEGDDFRPFIGRRVGQREGAACSATSSSFTSAARLSFARSLAIVSGFISGLRSAAAERVKMRTSRAGPPLALAAIFTRRRRRWRPRSSLRCSARSYSTCPARHPRSSAGRRTASRRSPRLRPRSRACSSR
jgi:hypothetical protein